ncbi:MAG: O-methyltransferase [Elusimicrobiota bacterium]
MTHRTGTDDAYRTAALLDFVTKRVSREDDVLRDIRVGAPKRGLPPISIGPDEGRILHFLVSTCRAEKIVEVGTLAGYSACWMARALPKQGRLHTIECDPKHAAVAHSNVARAGLSEVVTVHTGTGKEILPQLSPRGPFDLCFIDADKISYRDYVRWAADNVRSGGLVICDNAYLFGRLHREDLEPAHEEAVQAAAMRGALALLCDESLFSSCAMIPTSEGLAVAVRR